MIDYGKIDDGWEKKRQQLIIQAAGRVERIYNKAADRMAGYFNQIQPTEDLQKVWTKNPKISKKIDNMLAGFNKELESEIHRTFKDGWHLNNDKHDVIMADYLKGIAVGGQLKKGMFDRNMKAMDAFLKEGVYGKSISSKVWDLNRHYKEQLKFFAASGIGSGKDSRKIARDLKKYLNNPDKRFRRVRDTETGDLKTSAPAKNYHPGAGVYRSSYKNAWRYIASETNRAYRTADFNRIQQEPFVTGVEIKLSGAHPEYDICDEQVGKYPKGYKFTGFHAWCICYQKTILLSKKKFAKYLKDGTVNSNEYIQKLPDNAIKYLNNKAHKFKGKGKTPIFFRENFKKHGGKVIPKQGVTEIKGKHIADIAQSEIRDLTVDEADALENYQRIDSFAINKMYRVSKDVAKEIDSKGLKRISAIQPEEFKRLQRIRDNVDSALLHSPKYKGKVYRYMSFDSDDAYKQFMKNKVKGDYTSDPSFMSTSKDKFIAGEFGKGKNPIRFEIESIGKNGVELNKVIGDRNKSYKLLDEVLFQRNSTFEIDDIIKGDDLTIIKLREVAFMKKVKGKNFDYKKATTARMSNRKPYKMVDEPEIRDLTDDEIEYLNRYKQSSSINRYLRAGKNFSHDTYKKIDNYVSSAIRHSPKFEGEVYRGISLPSEKKNLLLSGMKEGDIYTDRGYMSTTMDRRVAEQFFRPRMANILLKIKAKKLNGIETNKVLRSEAKFRKEKEVLFHKDTSFRVLRKYNKEGVDIVELEEL